MKWTIGFLLLFVPAVYSVDLTVDELLDSAQSTAGRGKYADAVVLATQAITMEPKNAQAYGVRGRIHAAYGKHAKALADFDKTLSLEPRAVGVFQHRGVENFKLGHFKKSIADFDRYLTSRALGTVEQLING